MCAIFNVYIRPFFYGASNYLATDRSSITAKTKMSVLKIGFMLVFLSFVCGGVDAKKERKQQGKSTNKIIAD